MPEGGARETITVLVMQDDWNKKLLAGYHVSKIGMINSEYTTYNIKACCFKGLGRL